MLRKREGCESSTHSSLGFVLLLHSTILQLQILCGTILQSHHFQNSLGSQGVGGPPSPCHLKSRFPCMLNAVQWCYRCSCSLYIGACHPSSPARYTRYSSICTCPGCCLRRDCCSPPPSGSPSTGCLTPCLRTTYTAATAPRRRVLTWRGWRAPWTPWPALSTTDAPSSWWLQRTPLGRWTGPPASRCSGRGEGEGHALVGLLSTLVAQERDAGGHLLGTLPPLMGILLHLQERSHSLAVMHLTPELEIRGAYPMSWGRPLVPFRWHVLPVVHVCTPSG